MEKANERACLKVQREKKERTNYKSFNDVGKIQQYRVIQSVKGHIEGFKKYGFQSTRVDLVSTRQSVTKTILNINHDVNKLLDDKYFEFIWFIRAL